MEQALYDQNAEVQYRVENEVAILKFGIGVFEMGTNLAAKARFHALLDEMETSPDVKTMLFLNEFDALSEEEYSRFLHRMFGETGVGESAKAKNWLEREILFSREENAINQFVLRIHACQKIVVIGLQGAVATPFLGEALAADFRFASENAVFALSHVGLGVPPGGALGFFLPRFIGQGKAADLVFSGRTISAGEAYDLGLVNAVFPEDTFEAQCLERASVLSQIPLKTAAYTKALLAHPSAGELQHYLEKELNIMRHAWADRSRQG